MRNPLMNDTVNDTTTDPDLMSVANPAADQELADLFLAHPWLASLEPFYADWEFVWPM